jgi:lysophospholipase L1-like esterase
LIIRRRRSAWRRYAAAASLFFVIGLGAAGFFGLVTGAFGPGQSQLAKSKSTRPTVESTPSALASAPKFTDRSDQASATQPTSAAAARQANANDLVVAAPPKDATPVDDSFTPEVAAVTSPDQPALGANGALARLPDLDVFEAEPNRGLEPPLVNGYDLLAQLKNREHPFVSPDKHQSLAQTKLPFSFRTVSYDRALESLAADQAPPADDVRVEDYLAAHEYDLPAAPGAGLALHVSGSTSPLEATAAHRAAARGADFHMLSLALQGASYDAHSRRPSHLIVMVDTSAAMQSQARMAVVKRGLAKLARHMRENDRVTLARFAETPSVVVENASREELAALANSMSLSATGGTANLEQAIEAVSRLARELQVGEPKRVVVLTSEAGNYDAADLPKTAQRLSELAQSNIPWRLVRLNATANDAHWDTLAGQANGKVADSQSPDELYQEMFESLTSWPAKVAHEVSVTIHFNPQVVAAYRLVGHEAATLTGLSPAPISIDLGVDQTATGVYEVALKPGTVDSVGSIEVVWKHAASRQPGSIRQPITRKQLEASFFDGPGWFQKAVIVAKGAEALRGSAYLPTARPTASILDVATRVDASLARQPDFSRFIDLLKTAQISR